MPVKLLAPLVSPKWQARNQPPERIKQPVRSFDRRDVIQSRCALCGPQPWCGCSIHLATAMSSRIWGSWQRASRPRRVLEAMHEAEPFDLNAPVALTKDINLPRYTPCVCAEFANEML